MQYKAIALFATFFLVLIVSFGFLVSADNAPQKTSATRSVFERFGEIPTRFEKNMGQFPAHVQYALKTPRYTAYITGQGLIVSSKQRKQEVTELPYGQRYKQPNKRAKQKPIEIDFLGANKQPAVGMEQLPGKVNYLLGNDQSRWIRNVPLFKEVTVQNVYSNIDMRYYKKGELLEYDFVVKPGGNVNDILLDVKNADSLEINRQGILEMKTGERKLLQHKPFIYQMIDDKKVVVEGDYEFVANRAVRFRTKNYDQSRPLIIDPVLEYSTLLGETYTDMISDVKVDATGVYVTGITDSDFFPTNDPVQANFAGGYNDAFVSKLSPDGTTLIYSTYIGGSAWDGTGQWVSVDYDAPTPSLAVNSLGEVYLAGLTGSSSDFPIVNAYQSVFSGGPGNPQGNSDGFLTKLNSAGNTIEFSTYIGGSGYDYIYDIKLDSAENPVIVGSSIPDSDVYYPTTTGVIQEVQPGSYDYDGVLSKFSTTGSLIFSTYLGGNNHDHLYGLALDAQDNIYVAGKSNSTNTLPIASAPQASRAGNYDVYIAKLNATATTLAMGTYWGGTGKDIARDITLDSAGNIIVVGDSNSTDYPTQNPYQPARSGSRDAVLVKMSDTGVIDFSTYVGGTQIEYGWQIDADSQDNIYFSGMTKSDNYPSVSPITALIPNPAVGDGDAYITQLTSDGASVAFSSRIGGDFLDQGYSVHIDTQDDIYIAGVTASDDFVTTPGVVQTTSYYYDDGFLVKLEGDNPTGAAPDISVTSPANGSVINSTTPTFSLAMTDNGSGVDINTIEITVDGTLIATTCTGNSSAATCTPDQPVADGSVTLAASVEDTTGLRSTQDQVSITVDTEIPDSINLDNSDISGVIDGIVTITGDAGSVEGGAIVEVTNFTTGGLQTINANSDGSFVLGINASLEDDISVVVIDAAGNVSHAEDFTVTPPDPVNVAPSLDITGETSFSSGIEFLYSGNNPIQIGVTAGTIESNRASVVRGRVLDRSNQPLHGAKVVVHQHDEYGYTITRQNGEFDLAVNGGGILTIEYTKEGYLPVQRKLNTKWNDYSVADDVVMIKFDSAVTSIDLNTPTMQIAQSSISTDADGDRQATVVFPQGTTATLMLPDGSSQTLSTINFRATEYTVGENGPEAMPGVLPETSAYTYAVELSLDEAISTNATSVQFNQPVPLYVDNFLGFSTGSVVPAGYYDFIRAEWVPMNNGKVIEVLGVNSQGEAELDLSGLGVAANQQSLDELGISSEEQLQIALLYDVGDSIWRTPLSHFTPIDLNWAPLPPEDLGGLPDDLPEGGLLSDTSSDDSIGGGNDDCTGCIIEPQSQALKELIPVTSTPFSLNYNSTRQSYPSQSSIRIPISGSAVSQDLKNIEVIIKIAGKKFTNTYPASPNQTITFNWDGTDVYGREVNEAMEASILIVHIYNLYYYEKNISGIERAFAKLRDGSGQQIVDRSAQHFGLVRTFNTTLRRFDIKDTPGSIGGWTLSPHHFYSQSSMSLLKGDGTTISAAGIPNITKTVASNINANGVKYAPDGSIYYSLPGNARVVNRLNRDGTITHIAGNGSLFGGDGGLAVNAGIYEPTDIEISEDGTIYIAEKSGYKIRKIDSNGIITTYAGSASAQGNSGDGGLAIMATIDQPKGIALADDGSLYISSGSVIRKVNTDGTISTIAGTEGTQGFSGDGDVASLAILNEPSGLSIGPDGEIYFADSKAHVVRKINKDGEITTVAGVGSSGYSGDGSLATLANLDTPLDVEVTQAGDIFISDTGNCRLRHVSPAGIIKTVAGSGDCSIVAQQNDIENFALATSFSSNFITADTKGNIIYPIGGIMLRKLVTPFPNSSDEEDEYVLVSEDGLELYTFDLEGKHIKTSDSVTGNTIYSFSYSTSGFLTEVIDIDGDITQIERDSNNNPIAIISSDNQRTELGIDSEGYLSEIRNPNSESYFFQYNTSGWLTQMTNPRGYLNTFQYDLMGRLLSDVNAVGGGWTLTRTESPDNADYSVQMVTGEGRVYEFSVENDNTFRVHTNTKPDGTTIVKRFGKDGSSQITGPSGMVTSTQRNASPRFGVLAPLETITKTTPSGLNYTYSRDRNITLNDENDLLSVNTITDTSIINGRSYISIYDESDNKWTELSPEGRSQTRVLNQQGRVISSTIPGIAPVQTSFDLEGKLTSITEDDGSNPRTTTLNYYTSGSQTGWLSSVTDASNQQINIEYDNVGRINKRILEDLSEINYTYDQSGNISTVMTPKGDIHSFTYTELNLGDTYSPPAVTGIANPDTKYSFNLDKQLELVTRPDLTTIDYIYNAVSGKLESIQIPQGTYSLNYSASSGQLSNITDPDGGQLTFAYDGPLLLSATWNGEISGSFAQLYVVV